MKRTLLLTLGLILVFTVKAEFSAGFARCDINPQMGCRIPGYFHARRGKGTLDPLRAECVAFCDGVNTALVFSVDNIHVQNVSIKLCHDAIKKALGLDRKYVYIASTHTHTGATLRIGSDYGDDFTDEDKYNADLYVKMFVAKLTDLARDAVADLKPAKLSSAIGHCPGVGFCRRFLMKDGYYLTNPGIGNANIVRPAVEQDDEVRLLRIDREGGKPIAVVNFGTHPDMISGEFYSADWPATVRNTMEKAFDNELHCFFINGAQGDSNHIDVVPHPNRVASTRYRRAQHVGRSIAGIAMGLWENCEKLEAGEVRGSVREVGVKTKEVTPEKLEAARKIVALDKAGKRKEIPSRWGGMDLFSIIGNARAIVALEHGPKAIEMPVSVVSIGKSVAFGGFPGEPFMSYGRKVKTQSPFAFTIISCLTNGSHVYLPSDDAYAQGGYEVGNTKYASGIEATLVGAIIEEMNDLYKANEVK